MNIAPESYIRVQEKDLMAFACTCLERVGLDSSHAKTISRLLVNSDLRGVRSHGTRALNRYSQSFEEGLLNPRPEIRQIHETPTAVVLDGDGTLGYLPMVMATEGAISKANQIGIGMGLVRNIGHYGSAGHYARICADNGCIGFSVQGYLNLGAAGHVTAGRNPDHLLAYFGNPPICFAMPAGDEPPVVLDAATCILADDQRGPQYEDLFSQIPAAFFKSIGYGAVANLMGGGLTGFTLAEDANTQWSMARHGGMVLAIHVDSVVPEAVFRAESDRMVRDVRENYVPMPKTDRALLPGAIEEERFAQYRSEGIPYGKAEQEAAQAMGHRLGVPLPWN